MLDQSRRRFITLLGGAAAAWPLAARAQEPGRVYRLGVLSSIARDTPQVSAAYEELRRAGFVEGRNLLVVAGGHGLRPDEFARQAQTIATSSVDAVYAGGETAVRAAQAATRVVPIVGIVEDMVGAGLVHSLARPGGNTTGVSMFAADLNGKRQELLIEAVPGARRLAALADVNMVTATQLKILQEAAGLRGVELATYSVRGFDEIGPAIGAAKAGSAAAINVLGSPLLNGGSGGRLINERAAALKLPAMFQWPEWADDGGFIGYGPSRPAMFSQAARLLIKVLRGANPADLPVEQPTRFELVINLRTAKAAGIEVPAALALRADRIIE